MTPTSVVSESRPRAKRRRPRVRRVLRLALVVLALIGVGGAAVLYYRFVRLSFATDERTLREGCEAIVRYLDR